MRRRKAGSHRRVGHGPHARVRAALCAHCCGTTGEVQQGEHLWGVEEGKEEGGRERVVVKLRSTAKAVVGSELTEVESARPTEDSARVTGARGPGLWLTEGAREGRVG